jgi:hypothetical protein
MPGLATDICTVQSCRSPVYCKSRAATAVRGKVARRLPTLMCFLSKTRPGAVRVAWSSSRAKGNDAWSPIGLGTTLTLAFFDESRRAKCAVIHYLPKNALLVRRPPLLVQRAVAECPVFRVRTLVLLLDAGAREVRKIQPIHARAVFGPSLIPV